MTEPNDPDKKETRSDPDPAPNPVPDPEPNPAADSAGETQETAAAKSRAKLDIEEALALDRRVGDFLLALGFFTRLPAPMDEETASRPLAGAAWVFPVVGAIVGIAGGLTAALTASLPDLAVGLIAVVVMTALAGGLHEDGLADCADGLWSGKDAEERIRIMHDSRIGAFGVIALITVIGLKVAAIAQILGTGGVWPAALAILAGAAASRGLLPVAMNMLPLAGETGRAAAAGQPDAQDMLAAAALSVLISLLTIGFIASAYGLIIGGALAAGLGILAVKRIGGYTGDILGAQQQILETGILLAAATAV